MAESVIILFFFALFSCIIDTIFKCCILSEIHEMKKLQSNSKNDEENKDA